MKDPMVKSAAVESGRLDELVQRVIASGLVLLAAALVAVGLVIYS